MRSRKQSLVEKRQRRWNIWQAGDVAWVITHKDNGVIIGRVEGSRFGTLYEVCLCETSKVVKVSIYNLDIAF